MSSNAKKGPGGHYSGANPVPTIQKFIESLDADKKHRDAQIESQQGQLGGSDVVDHQEDGGQPKGKAGTRKTVTDPVTGKLVQIEDVDADFMKAVENPVVSCPFYSLSLQ